MINKNDNVELDIEVYKTAVEFQRIMNDAVHEAQADARAAGVPNVYSINGILHWELPNGSLTTEAPTENRATKPEVGP